MTEQPKPIDRLLHDLGERAKELNCLYEVQELLGTSGITMDQICQGIIKVLPPGWQYPEVCQAEITYNGSAFRTPGFTSSPWLQSAEIVVQEEVVGSISVCYTEERPASDEGPFLKEERKLINTIADRLERRILHERLRSVFESQRSQSEPGKQWSVILDLLKRTDAQLLTRITCKML